LGYLLCEGGNDVVESRYGIVRIPCNMDERRRSWVVIRRQREV
jgi:hypothetical protein